MKKTYKENGLIVVEQTTFYVYASQEHLKKDAYLLMTSQKPIMKQFIEMHKDKTTSK